MLSRCPLPLRSGGSISDGHHSRGGRAVAAAAADAGTARQRQRCGVSGDAGNADAGVARLEFRRCRLSRYGGQHAAAICAAGGAARDAAGCCTAAGATASAAAGSGGAAAAPRRGLWWRPRLRRGRRRISGCGAASGAGSRGHCHQRSVPELRGSGCAVAAGRGRGPGSGHGCGGGGGGGGSASGRSAASAAKQRRCLKQLLGRRSPFGRVMCVGATGRCTRSAAGVRRAPVVVCNPSPSFTQNRRPRSAGRKIRGRCERDVCSSSRHPVSWWQQARRWAACSPAPASLMRRRHRRRSDTKTGQKRRPGTLNPKPARGGDVLVRGEERRSSYFWALVRVGPFAIVRVLWFGRFLYNYAVYRRSRWPVVRHWQHSGEAVWQHAPPAEDDDFLVV